MATLGERRQVQVYKIITGYDSVEKASRSKWPLIAAQTQDRQLGPEILIKAIPIKAITNFCSVCVVMDTFPGKPKMAKNPHKIQEALHGSQELP
jgi:hypothetical protein